MRNNQIGDAATRPVPSAPSLLIGLGITAKDLIRELPERRGVSEEATDLASRLELRPGFVPL